MSLRVLPQDPRQPPQGQQDELPGASFAGADEGGDWSWQRFSPHVPPPLVPYSQSDELAGPAFVGGEQQDWIWQQFTAWTAPQQPAYQADDLVQPPVFVPDEDAWFWQQHRVFGSIQAILSDELLSPAAQTISVDDDMWQPGLQWRDAPRAQIQFSGDGDEVWVDSGGNVNNAINTDWVITFGARRVAR